MIDYNFKDFNSDYLCPYCGGLLYLDTATPKNDVCINENCQLWPSDIKSIVHPTEIEEPRIYREIQEEEKLLIDEIQKWEPGRLARYAYKARRELITTFFTKGKLPSPIFIGVVGPISAIFKVLVGFLIVF